MPAHHGVADGATGGDDLRRGVLGAEQGRSVLTEGDVVRVERRPAEDLALVDAQQLTRAAGTVKDLGGRPLNHHADLQRVEEAARAGVELDGREWIGQLRRDVRLSLRRLALRVPQGHLFPRSHGPSPACRGLACGAGAPTAKNITPHYMFWSRSV